MNFAILRSVDFNIHLIAVAVVLNLPLSQSLQATPNARWQDKIIRITDVDGITTECKIIEFQPIESAVNIAKVSSNVQSKIAMQSLDAPSQQKVRNWFQKKLLSQHLNVTPQERIVLSNPTAQAVDAAKEAFYEIEFANPTAYTLGPFDVYYFIPVEIPDVVEECVEAVFEATGIEGSFRVNGIQPQSKWSHASERGRLTECEFVDTVSTENPDGEAAVRCVTQFKMSEPLGILLSIYHDGEQVAEYRSFKDIQNIDKLFLKGKDLRSYQEQQAAATRTLEHLISSAAKTADQRKITKIVEEKCADLDHVRSAVVDVRGNRFNGTGFFAEVDGRYYVIAPSSTLARNDTYAFIDQKGKRHRAIGDLTISQSTDMARVPIAKPSNYLQFPPPDNQPVKAGTSICIAGHDYAWPRYLPVQNEEPTPLHPITIYTQTTGFNRNRIELSGSLNAITHGSPIVKCPEGSLLAVAHVSPNYLQDDQWEQAPSFYKTNNFALRVDTLNDWQKSNHEHMNQDFKKLAGYLHVLMEGQRITQQMDAGKIPLPQSYMHTDFTKILTHFHQQDSTYKNSPNALLDLKAEIVTAITHYYVATVSDMQTAFLKKQINELNFVKNWQIRRIEISTLD